MHIFGQPQSKNRRRMSAYESTTSSEKDRISHTPNVIIFGQTGAGKSSLINMLAPEKLAKVSNQAAGCTITSEDYKVSRFQDIYTFWDTPGLNEGEHGSVPTQEAIANLYNLVRELGINLIVYCVRGSRFTEIVRVNYDLFWGIMCEGKVPIVLVVTGLELQSDMDDWWKKNERLVERMGIAFDGHACVTTISGVHEEKFRESEDKIWELVKRHCSPNPWAPSPQFLAEVPRRIDTYMKRYNARSGKERRGLPVFHQHASKSRSASTQHNIILFGEAGTGKSSIVNMVVGADVATVSSGPLGCTFENECYEARIGDTTYCIYDTVGLNEGDKGRVPHWKAIQELYKLIRELDGISLLIFCMRGRITQNAQANWFFFLEVLCNKNVPIIAVVTGLEHEMENELTHEEMKGAMGEYGMHPIYVACVVGIRGKNNEHEARYKRSQEQVRNLITKSHLPEPWSIEKDEWFIKIFENVFTMRFCFLPGTRLEFVHMIFDKFKEQSQMTDEEFKTLSNTLIKVEKKVLKKKFPFRK